MLRTFVILCSLALGAVIPAADAATLTIGSITGTWNNVTTVAGPTGPLTGTGTSKISWGAPAGARNTQSSYNFKSSAPSTHTASGSFLIGEYVHTNGVIWANSVSILTSRLAVNLTGTADGQAFSLASLFGMTHNETLNSAACPTGQRPCGDLVTIATLSGAPLTITTATNVFTLMIDGFVSQLGGAIVTNFLTPEAQARSLYLQASLTVQAINTPPPPPPPPPAVPLPAGAVLLAGALGGLALIRRRRR